ncbi:hypothetical protein ANANG_G00291020 [Anguilla anguilla]|uniref:Scaffolding anchor of CK1 domain-containing protein n=1 Tax=Anguilla anguilla TaxID=7936 RepID=A0A9D3RJ72_ANGAN|nr:hypothetical protein ANANG_G00291020 [Anguilla anguilla]
MALSQVECLDDNHENLPLEDSKPEFLYSEDQRLALEALIHGGRKAFQEYIQDHSVRQFLSEPEQNQLTGAAVAHQPESEEEGAKNGEDVAGSLQYWPDRSDCSIPEFDIGWPDRVSYRGVTRVSVYTQPPMDGKTHIKEIVRKTITLAQKVIAVVMDLFTDVDIFQDLLDASFRRRVAVYIILEATGIPYFLSMCKKAAMHQGHLKNLRVRTAGGTVLHTHSHRKVCGQLSQKFMFVDGDRAVTGSYSYTWMASRLDRNLVTVLTGEAVETFDRQFRELYLLSEGVSLSEIGLEAEPEPQLASQLAVPSTPSPTTARKDMNPKYALLSTSTKGSTNSSGVQNVSERSGTRTTGFPRPAVKILRQLREVAEPPIHPALQDLERANMMYYLTTWPEPDPSIDVIEDCSEPPQAHLTQAELDETSQPICFKDALVHSTDSQEPIQTSSRPPASKVHYQQEVPVWGSTNTAGTRLDGHIQSPNLAGGITGGHPFWNANQLALSRPGWGSNPPSRDQPSSVRGFASNWPAQTQLGSQAYHAPNRQLQGWPQGQLGWARPTHQGPAPAHWPPGPQGDARGHPSPLFNRHTLHRAVNGNEPEAQLWMR